MAKKLIFCFDGTANEPSDADQGTTWLGAKEDEGISNVFKLHLLLGGDLSDGNAHKLSQRSLYYSGVGTYGSTLKRLINSGLALRDPGRIINAALDDLDKYYKNGDQIFIFGFSRGAAIGRKFASVIAKDPKRKHKIRFLGCFDTVASIGMPDLSKKHRPKSDVLFENRHIAPNIIEALHLCSIDEKRLAFQPTLMNAEPRISEVWFAGAHSDVGGGYWRDGLSDNTLRFMLDEIERRKLGLRLIAASEIDYETVSRQADAAIDYEDVVMEANPMGINHQQERFWPVSELTLYNRKVCVVSNDKLVKTPKPVIHHSVVERIHADNDYRPESLRRQAHRVLDSNGMEQAFSGLGQHLQTGTRLLKHLEAGESCQLRVFAHLKHNHSGLLLEKGARYQFKAPAGQKWQDGGISCSPAGWDRDTQDLGWIKALLIRGSESLRRQPDAKWFALIGALGDSDEELFTIGSRKVHFTPRRSAEFCPFANDLNRFYSNNNGSILVDVLRLPE